MGKHKRHAPSRKAANQTELMAGKPPERQKDISGSYWMYGAHACEAALGNASRRISRMVVTAQAAENWKAQIKTVGRQLAVDVVDGAEISRLCGQGAVHQGVAMQVQPLTEVGWEETLTAARCIAVMDQVTDPHNVGAILRSAAAFGVGALLMPKDHSPPESAVLAKSACGALERVPCFRVTNLAHTLKDLKAMGFWIVGLDADATKPVAVLREYLPLCVVLGAEGAGLRRLTREHCDLIAAIPISNDMESLNVSNAAAIAFYAAAQATPAKDR